MPAVDPKSKDAIVKLARSELRFSVKYPKENPRNSIEDIVNTLKYIGIFDNLAK
jgi:hypothetical protein